jgi:hypothetical protein
VARCCVSEALTSKFLGVKAIWNPRTPYVFLLISWLVF